VHTESVEWPTNVQVVAREGDLWVLRVPEGVAAPSAATARPGRAEADLANARLLADYLATKSRPMRANPAGDAVGLTARPLARALVVGVAEGLLRCTRGRYPVYAPASRPFECWEHPDEWDGVPA
jgi:hypothetical protein